MNVLGNTPAPAAPAPQNLAIPALLAAASAALWSVTGTAQEALRASIASEQAAESRRKAIENRDYNLKLGRLNFLFSATLGVELTDNAVYVQSNTSEDLILRPGLNIAGNYPVSQQNAITFSVGIGYQKYLNNDRYDRFLVTPGTEVGFDLFIKDFRFRIYDRFSYTTDPLEVGAVSGVAEYGGLNNVAGIEAAWDLNQVILKAGYGHGIWQSASPSFSYLDRSTELFSLSAQALPNQPISPGIEATGNLNSYDTPLLFDSVSYSFGPSVRWRVSRHLQLEARAGYVAYDFDEAGRSLKSDDVQDWYAGLDISHVVNQFVSHSISFSRGFNLGVYSSYYETTAVRYGINWGIIRRAPLATSFGYEQGKQPAYASVTALPIGALVTFRDAEEWTRYGATVSIGYQLTPKLNGSLAYRFYLRNSNVGSRDYTQNALTLSLTYRF